MVLERPAVLTGKVKLACLPQQGVDVPLDYTCYITGTWTVGYCIYVTQSPSNQLVKGLSAGLYTGEGGGEEILSTRGRL